MRIGIAQMHTRAGDFDGTARRMVEASRRAAETGVDLLAFPAATLAGVAPVSLSDREGFLLDLIECLMCVIDDLACPCLVPLLVDTGDAVLPEALLIDDEDIRPVRFAARLEAMSARGADEGVVDALPEIAFRGARLGVAFTYEDLNAYDDYEYNVDVIVFLSGYGFAIDDPSSALGSSITEGRFLSDAETTGAWIVGVGSLGCYATQVFCGSSFVLAPWGELAAQSPSFEDDLLVYDVDPSAEGPLAEPVTPEVYDGTLMLWGALGAGLSSLVADAGSDGACVVVTCDLAHMLLAVLAVDALGPTNVGAVVACGAGAEKDAAVLDLVRSLRLDEGSVERVDVGGTADPAAAGDLLEARLAAMARATGRVPLGARDKTARAVEERASSLSAARIEPFADVYRSDVLALAGMRNTISPLLPLSLFTDLGPLMLDELVSAAESPQAHLDFVDSVLTRFVEWELPVSDIVAELGHADDVVAVVSRLHDLEAVRGRAALAPTVSSRTLDEARLPVGLAWRDRARDASERLASRLGEFAGEQDGDKGADAARPGADGGAARPREGEVRDLMGYLRDFSAGGAFSSIGGSRGSGRDDRHDGTPPSSSELWNGPFSEN